MKQLYTSILLALLTVASFAQTPTASSENQAAVAKNAAKVQEKVDNNYNRASISMVLINHNDKYDDQVATYFRHIEWGDKFDHNLIETKIITTSQPRTYESSSSSDRFSQIGNCINATPFGREVVSYIYSRQSNGMMSDLIIKKRGRYNATDQDLLSAQATKLGTDALADEGFKLISNSYVLFVDYTNISVTTSEGKTYYSARPEAYLYRVKYDEKIQDQLFETWIYREDETEVRRQKNELFQKIPFDIEPINKLAVSVSTTDESGAMAGLIKSGYEQIIYELERKVDQFQVRTPVVDVKPIRAKIGMKEGLKSTARYFSYKFKLMDDGQTIVPVKTGVVRATKVVDNRKEVDGQSLTSEFFQIAGPTVRQGQILKQKNDIGLGLAVGYQFLGFPGAHISVDKLLSINTKGIATYLMIDASIMPYSPQTRANQMGVQLRLTPDMLLGANVAVGFGVGFHFARIFEIQPQIHVGVDMLTQMEDYTLSQVSSTLSGEAQFKDKIAYTGQIGAKLFCNIAYPLQAFVGVNYSLRFSEGVLYQFYRQEVLNHLNQQRAGFGVNVGLKYIF